MRPLVAALAVLLCSCNSAPANTCIPTGHSIGAAATSPSTCSGICASLVVDAGGDASVYELCVSDCTDGGNAACEQGMTCVSAEPIKDASYCLFLCDDAGACPTPLTCATDGGFCL